MSFATPLPGFLLSIPRREDGPTARTPEMRQPQRQWGVRNTVQQRRLLSQTRVLLNPAGVLTRLGRAPHSAAAVESRCNTLASSACPLPPPLLVSAPRLFLLPATGYLSRRPLSLSPVRRVQSRVSLLRSFFAKCAPR